MIDPTKPMYDAEGREWVALRIPDGSVWYRSDSVFLAVRGDIQSATIDLHGKGVWDGSILLSNTKPQKDCDERVSVLMGADKDYTTLVLHRRNGVITAEVVNND